MMDVMLNRVEWVEWVSSKKRVRMMWVEMMIKDWMNGPRSMGSCNTIRTERQYWVGEWVDTEGVGGEERVYRSCFWS